MNTVSHAGGDAAGADKPTPGSNGPPNDAPPPKGSGENDATEPTRGGLPPEWRNRAFVQSVQAERFRFLRPQRPPKDPATITWRLEKGAVQYGIGTFKTSFADRGNDLSFGNRIPQATELDAALFLARHRIDTGAWPGPLMIAGSDAYKGAVLARAVELDIPLGNPELVMLQDVLRRQRGLVPTDEKVNTLYSKPQQTQHVDQQPGQSTQTTVESATRSQASPSVDTVKGETVPATTPGRSLAADAVRILESEQPAHESIREVRMPPETHGANETQIYEVVASSASEIAVSFRDGSFMIVPRTAQTADLGPEDFVKVSTRDGKIVDVGAYEAQTRITVAPTTTSQAHEEIVFRNAEPTTAVGMSRNLLEGLLDSEAVEALTAKNIAIDRIKAVDFVLPVKNATLTVLARNEAGFALQVNNFGHYSLVDPAKVPLPDVPAGAQVAFRTVDGSIRAMDSQAAKRLDAAKPKQSVTA